MNLWFLCATPPFLCKTDYISDSRSHILTPVTPKHLLSTPNSASPTRSTERGKFTHSGREQAIIFYVYNMEAQTEKYKYPSLTTDSRPTLVLAGGGWADSLLLWSSSLVRLFWGLLGLYGVMHKMALVTTKTVPPGPSDRPVRGTSRSPPRSRHQLQLFLREGTWLPN